MDDRKNREVIIIIVSVIVIILVAYLGISPVMAGLKDSNLSIATKGDDLKNAEENLDSLRNLQNSINSKTNEVNALISALPGFVDSEDLITTLEAVANRNGMKLTNITPLDSSSIAGLETALDADSSGGGLSLGEANYDIVVKGSFQALQKFVSDLELNRRPINISSIVISKESNTEGGSILNVTISLTTYYSQTAQ